MFFTSLVSIHKMSHRIRKSVFCKCEKKCAEQQSDRFFSFRILDKGICLVTLSKSSMHVPNNSGLAYILLPGQKLRRQVFTGRGSKYIKTIPQLLNAFEEVEL